MSEERVQKPIYIERMLFNKIKKIMKKEQLRSFNYFVTRALIEYVQENE